MNAHGGLVFVFSGHGCQWNEMARELLDASPLFASHIQACERALAPHIRWSLTDVLRGKPRARRLQRVDVVQPALFAVTVSLAELWRACGVLPDAVVGHSQGEVAAAYLAGALSLEDAAMVVARRSRVLAELSGRGRMVAISSTRAWLEEQIESLGQLDLGAVNGPRSLAVGGPARPLEELLRRCKADSLTAGRVAIDYASHSRQIEPLRERLLEELVAVRPHPAKIPFFSTVTGGLLDSSSCDAEHWYRAERGVVQFERATRALLQEGHATFLEIAPHPVLAAAMQETVDIAYGEQANVLIASTLRRGQGGPGRFWSALGEVSAHGVAVDWDGAREALGSTGSEVLDGGGAPAEHHRREPSGQIPLDASPSQIEELAPLAAQIEGKAAPEREHMVLAAVAAEVASVLGIAPLDRAMTRRPFKELGLDSAGVVALRNRLRTLTGLRVSATSVFDCPTPTALAERMCEQMTRKGASAKAPKEAKFVPADVSEGPIAIVGMSCRFPGGVTSPEDLWRLLISGGDAVGAFPTDRGWDLEALYDPDPDRSGTTYAREGGFLYDAALFDAGFFGISPREALAMDPQQRLLLEACWEAFEAAGIDGRSLHGSKTGVYAGINRLDYNPRLWLDPDGLEGYNMTGGSASVIAGRVSYVFGLQGPAMTIDTACSSSLVALHLACTALRRGECELALAAGVSVTATPGLFAAFSRQRALAADGRCKSFAEGADGTGWGEGVGVLMLERLEQAERNGHHVVALVRGSAINQDGASNGLTAPSGVAQQRVIRQALASAGLSAEAVDVVEAHGTGTELGDPIEAHALLATYGQERPPERPLWLGSVKSNIGHTQAAAGVAGVIKMALAMDRGVLPKSLHIDEPSSEIDWATGSVSLLTENRDWPALERPRRAGVSSYGISGTNAHVILEQAPSVERAEDEREVEPAERKGCIGEPERGGEATAERGGEPTAVSWALSARDAPALMAQAQRLQGFLAGEQAHSVRDIGLSLSRRSSFEHRTVVAGEGVEQLSAGLAALSGGETAPNLVRGVVGREGERLALMFTGQGAQRVGMGAELYRSFPVFAAAFDEVCLHMDPLLGCSLHEVVMDESSEDSSQAARLDATMFTQAGLFALEVSLFRLVHSWGVKPDYLMGHSIGELTAAFVADAFSLTDACRLVAARGRLMGALPQGGAMVAVQASERELAETIVGLEERVALAGINGPSSVVISGDEAQVLEVARIWEERGRKTKRLRVSHAFHSPHMDGMLVEFKRLAEEVSFREPSVPVVSNVTGEPLSGELCTADYWVRHVREPVRFADGVRWLCAQGVGSFLELGPDGVLSGMASEAGVDVAQGDSAEEPSFVAVPAMRRDRPETLTLHGALGQVWVRGVDVAWEAICAAPGVRQVPLPAYPFQREHYWICPTADGATDAEALGQSAAHHPLLGASVTFAQDKSRLFTGRLSLESQAWLADHVVFGTTLLPGSALLELALHVGGQVGWEVVHELTLRAPLVLPERGGVQLQIVVGEPDETNRRSIAIHSRAEGSFEDDPSLENGWTCHASGLLEPESAGRSQERLLAIEQAWPPTGAVSIDVDRLYERMDEEGLESGPLFRCLRSVWRRAGETFAEVVLSAHEPEEEQAFALHPTLLDGALQALGAGALSEGGHGEQEHIWLPFCWNGVRAQGRGQPVLRARLSPVGEDTVSLVMFDEHGELVLSADSLSLRKISAEQLRQEEHRGGDSLFTVDWAVLDSRPANMDAPAPVAIGIGAGDAGVTQGLEALADLSVLGKASASAGAPLARTAVVDLSSVDDFVEGDPVSLAHTTAHRVLALLREWLADERFSDSVLALVTRNVLATQVGEEVHGLASAPVWGMVRAAQSEHPGRLMLIDIDGAEESRKALRAAIASGEPQLAIRGGRLLAPRLLRLASSTSSTTDSQAPERSGTVLVTGGTGGLGAQIALHLARGGADHLLLASRRGLEAEGAKQLLGELNELGAQVSIKACDVSKRSQLECLLEEVPAEWPLRAVVHTAGALDDGVIDALTPERIDGVFAPKVDAAWHLHELTRHMQLREFVVFSSIAGVLGSSGQGNYAAANTFLDALVAHRRAQGLSGLSLAWGLWADAGGMRRGLREADMARVERAGMIPLSSEEGLELFDLARSTQAALAVPVGLDMPTLRKRAVTGSLPTLLASLFPGRRTSGKGREPGTSPASRLANLTGEEREREVLRLVRAETANVLGYSSPEAIEVERAFKDSGFDSLVGVELRNQLAGATGLSLPVTLVFDHPSPAAVARYLVGELAGSQAVESPSKPALAPAPVGAEDPIAIVGMSCRYPGGVSSPEELWQLIAGGGDAIGSFPDDRGWDLERLYDPDPDRAGTSYTREGGFVYDASEFDPAFFGIAPREALAMDPQQRLLLEVCWEAFERASIDPTSLRGSATGVFAGVMYHDYASRLGSSAPGDLEAYLGVGSAGSVVSGRTAYALGLEGPAVTVDTACSSSLVAMHWAAQALRSGECTLALAGGVTVLSTPGVFLEFSRQRGLAPDGRCKSFSSQADGTGWGEGAGVVLLERLSDARRNGRRVLALLRGSAVNQDGASNGLTAPNGPSQQRVIRQALANAALAPVQVDVVEGHGTGTTLGDPIEVQALLATYGQGRSSERPLWLGSVKSNLGHTQAAAGVAGVIKTVMAMRHESLPPTLHADRPSEKVDWSQGSVALLSSEQPWVRNGEPRRAGVSSFGISGTNAHVILEEAPDPDPRADERVIAIGGLDHLPWVIAGKGESALGAQAERLRAHVEANPDVPVRDVGLSLVNARTTTFSHRAVVLGSDRGALLDGLAGLREGAPAAAVVEGVAGETGMLAMLFTGQGAQRVGMGRELYEASPLFREALDEVCGHLDELLEHSLLDTMFARQGSHGDSDRTSGVDRDTTGDLLEDTSFAQPALFALELALYRLVESFELRPDFVMGHSIGELAAAQVAGVLSLEDACALVAARGRLMAAVPKGGAMVAVQASESEALDLLAGREGHVALAAVNGPDSVVLSGEEPAVLELAGILAEKGRKTSRLRVSHAFHSPCIETMLDEFRQVASQVKLHEPRIPLVSNVTGRALQAAELSAEYWVRHARETVRFADGVRWLRSQGVGGFLELGPDGVLSSMVDDCLRSDGHPEGATFTAQEISGRDSAELGHGGDIAPLAVSLLRVNRSEAGTLLHGLARLWVRGVSVDWSAAFEGSAAEPAELPTYAFQRDRYWLEAAPGGGGDPASLGQAQADHPLLGAAVLSAGEKAWLFTGRLSLATHPWLADHKVMGRVLLAGTALLELALYAGGQLGCDTVRELTLQEPLVLPAQGGVQLQVNVSQTGEDGARPLSIYSRVESHSEDGSDAETGWVCHAVGSLVASQDAHQIGGSELPRREWPPQEAEAVSVEEIYDRLATHGLDYGPVFQGLVRAWRSEQSIFAEVELPEDELDRANAFGLHPALLDGALHAMALLDPREGGDSPTDVSLPFSWRDVTLLSSGARVLCVQLSRTGEDATSIVVADGVGRPVATVGSLVTRRARATDLGGMSGGPDGLFCIDWIEASIEPASATLARGRHWALIGEDHPNLQVALEQSATRLDSYPDLRSLCEDVESGASIAPDFVLLNFTALEGEQPSAAHSGVAGALSALQQLLRDERLRDGGVIVLTSGAVSSGSEQGDLPDLAGAAVSGLVRSAQSENPGRFVLIDVDRESSSSKLLYAALATDEPQIAIRDGRLMVPRLARLTSDHASAKKSTGASEHSQQSDVCFDPAGTVLITGGTGGLGQLLARHLVLTHGVVHLLLASRSGETASGAKRLQGELEELGASVRIVGCDVSDRGQLESLISSVAADRPLRGVVHAAGVIEDGVIDSLTPEQVERVLRAKLDTAWHLHELTAHLDLDGFVLFSSIASIFGGPGQGNYAAANSFLEALAAYRRGLGLPAQAMAWGPWEQTTGMTGQLGQADLARIANSGMLTISCEQGLELFDAALLGGPALTVLMGLDMPVLRSRARGGELPSMLGGVVGRLPTRESAAGAGSSSLADQFAAAPVTERRRLVTELVRVQTAAVLGHVSAEAVDVKATFKDLGFDSLAAVELRNRLSASSGVQLTPTLVFDYPTLGALAGHLLEELSLAAAGPVRDVELDVEELTRTLSSISSEEAQRIGIAARLRDVLSQWSGGAEASDGDSLEEDLSLVADEEIFELIDREFGVS